MPYQKNGPHNIQDSTGLLGLLGLDCRCMQCCTFYYYPGINWPPRSTCVGRNPVIIDHDLSFGILTNLFLLGWCLLLVGLWCGVNKAPRRWLLIIGGRAIPIVLCLAFAIGYVGSRDQPGGITSFAAVLTTYSMPDKVLSAWFELLRLSLFACRWIVDDAAKLGLPRFLAALALVLGFVATAFGLLFYSLARFFYWRRRNYS